ncbi:MAG TPA: SDR family NAD(P)-dependent oxidoreductase [Lentzea sp.]|nr:SDR family NAD(P)-dependent oxidoreductase [Lentzea sp.]HUQ61603.1 SDR family NAD(P)-dependent oxidoreductase [Lentzea sp.]
MRALVNNAGVPGIGPVQVLPLDRWRHLFEVSLFGPVAVTQALLPALRRGKGPGTAAAHTTAGTLTPGQDDLYGPLLRALPSHAALSPRAACPPSTRRGGSPRP